MVKLRSFRLRIALLSALLAGGAIAGFAIASWLLIYDAKLTRLDSEIKSQLLQESAPPRPPNYWHSYATSLVSVFGLRRSQSDIALLVIDPEGKPLHQSANWTPQFEGIALFPPVPPFPPPPPPRRRFPEGRPAPQEPLGRLSQVITQRTSNGTWRVGAVSSPFVRMAIAVNLQVVNYEMSAISNVFLISIPVVLILVAVGAWVVSGTILKPLHEVTSAIRRVTAKGLDQRIPSSTADIEFVELLQVFNQMMERLERSFKQASRFSADAAHELKTPLAILQGELERSLHQAPLGSQQQQNLSNLLDEVRRLGAIVRKLLLLSLADAGQMRLHWQEVNLSTVLTDLVDDIEMLAPHLQVESKIAPTLRAQADQDLLKQVLHNLIDNAIKYNLPDGWIKIHARYQAGTVAVTISNRSYDISVGDRDRIFDRFHRGTPAREPLQRGIAHRQIEGVGLGLSLSREIARAHGGDLKLDPTPVGQTTFTLTLPIVQQKN